MSIWRGLVGAIVSQVISSLSTWRGWRGWGWGGGLACLLSALRMLSSLPLSPFTLPVLFSTHCGQGPYVVLNEAYPRGAGFTCSMVEPDSGVCHTGGGGIDWRAFGLSYLTFLNTWSHLVYVPWTLVPARVKHSQNNYSVIHSTLILIYFSSALTNCVFTAFVIKCNHVPFPLKYLTVNVTDLKR